jgi:hypothetical protein
MRNQLIDKAHSAREIVRLSAGIFRKYPSQTWYICLITPTII